MEPVIIICVIVVVLFAAIMAILSRYRKCPSDKVLVIYGKVGTDKNGQESRNRQERSSKKRKMYPRRCGIYRANNPIL